MSLLGDSQALVERRRVNGATVRKNFTKAIQDKGGDEVAQEYSTATLTREMMDCSPQDLYRETGAKQGQRETLPERAQEALMTGEIVSTHDLKQKSITGNQQQRNQQIEGSVRESGKKVRKLFPW